MAPRQTSAEIIHLFNKKIDAGLKDPAISKQLAEIDTTPLAGTPAEFEKLLSTTSKWCKVDQSRRYGSKNERC